MSTDVNQLTRAIETAKSGTILFVTGAGVSLASGIPTFRGNDPGAIWKRDVTTLGTHSYFLEDPAGSLSWYLSRFANLKGKLPNDGHRAIAALERWQLQRGGDFLLITQNIDTLHEQAGSKAMIKIHGTSDRFRCDQNGCMYGPPRGSIPEANVDFTQFLASPTVENVPRCPACGGYLRAHVLWFDEYYHGHLDYQVHKAMHIAEKKASLVIFAGTSFAVGITAMVMSAANMRKVPVYNIDPTPRVEDDRIIPIVAGSEIALRQVCESIGIPLTVNG